MSVIKSRNLYSEELYIRAGLNVFKKSVRSKKIIKELNKLGEFDKKIEVKIERPILDCFNPSYYVTTKDGKNIYFQARENQPEKIKLHNMIQKHAIAVEEKERDTDHLHYDIYSMYGGMKTSQIYVFDDKLLQIHQTMIAKCFDYYIENKIFRITIHPKELLNTEESLWIDRIAKNQPETLTDYLELLDKDHDFNYSRIIAESFKVEIDGEGKKEKKVDTHIVLEKGTLVEYKTPEGFYIYHPETGEEINQRYNSEKQSTRKKEDDESKETMEELIKQLSDENQELIYKKYGKNLEGKVTLPLTEKEQLEYKISEDQQLEEKEKTVEDDFKKEKTELPKLQLLSVPQGLLRVSTKGEKRVYAYIDVSRSYQCAIEKSLVTKETELELQERLKEGVPENIEEFTAILANINTDQIYNNIAEKEKVGKSEYESEVQNGELVKYKYSNGEETFQIKSSNDSKTYFLISSDDNYKITVNKKEQTPETEYNFLLQVQQNCKSWKSLEEFAKVFIESNPKGYQNVEAVSFRLMENGTDKDEIEAKERYTIQDGRLVESMKEADTSQCVKNKKLS